jgi:hypothetical protein
MSRALSLSGPQNETTLTILNPPAGRNDASCPHLDQDLWALVAAAPRRGPGRREGQMRASSVWQTAPSARIPEAVIRGASLLWPNALA